MVDFSKILEAQSGSAAEPKKLPQGTYFGTLAAVPTTRVVKTKEGERGLLRFKFDLNDAGDDVDPDELGEAGGLRTPSGTAVSVYAEFWLDTDGGPTYGMDQFLRTFQVEGFGEGKSYSDVFKEIVGREVVIALTKETQTGRDGQTFVKNEVKRAHAAS